MNLDKEINKYDQFNPSYIGGRQDILRLIPNTARLVLDVGCSTGVLGASVKAFTGAKVVGIEYSKEMAGIACRRIDEVLIGDAEKILSDGILDKYSFDTIIFADVLEHMKDPWKSMQKAVRLLKPNGRIISSIPNVRHIDTIYNLVIKGYWPYRSRGIHDRSHLRFFTKKNIVELIESSGMCVEVIQCNYRLLEKPCSINRFAKYFAVPGIRCFLVFQYLICSRKTIC